MSGDSGDSRDAPHTFKHCCLARRNSQHSFYLITLISLQPRKQPEELYQLVVVYPGFTLACLSGHDWAGSPPALHLITAFVEVYSFVLLSKIHGNQLVTI